MSEFIERMKKLKEDTGLKNVDIAEKMLVSASYVSHLITGHRKPGRKTLMKLSEIFGVSIDYLVGSDKAMPDNDYRMVPVISFVRAGAWHEASDPYAPGVADYWIPVETNDESAIGLSVVGDSMEPEYRAGDIIIVSPVLQPQVGHDVVARWNGEVVLKRLKKYEEGMVILMALNPAYDSWVIQGSELSDFRIVGPVVGQHRNRRVEVGAVVKGGE